MIGWPSCYILIALIHFCVLMCECECSMSVSVYISLCVLVCVSCLVCMWVCMYVCVCVFALMPWCGSQIKLPEVSFYLHHVGLKDRIQIT